MNCSMEVIDAAVIAVKNDLGLMGALLDWHSHKGRLCREEIDKPFDKWLRKQLDYTVRQLGHVDPTPQNIVKALEVEAIGDKLALYWASRMRREYGLSVDTDCYVKDGVVNTNIWLCGKRAVFVKSYAEEVAKGFQRVGYSAEIRVDEEDDREVTVNAVLDFSLYYKNAQGGNDVKR